MQNLDIDNTDEGRMRRLIQRMQKNQTDVVRLWQRLGQGPDGVGDNLSGPEAPVVSYSPAQAPTTTSAPTTTTTTTPAPVIDYLYPIWDRLRSGLQFSSGTEAWSLLDDRDGDWPDHADYIIVHESTNAGLGVWLDPLFPFSSLASVEIQLYCQNESASSLLLFTAQILGDDETTNLTALLNISGVGTSEGSFSLRTGTFTLEAEAQDWWRWTRPRLNLDIETDTDHGSPDFLISAVRVKPTYIPLF